MKVAVTGASGFIGRTLCTTLSAAGHEVMPVRGPQVEGADAVVHLAAIAHRRASADELRKVNVALAVDVGRAAAAAGFAGIGIWAKNWEQMQLIPMLVVTPLTFLGGAFYSIDMLPPAWRTATLFNPVVYLISGFRWSFFGTSDVGVSISLAMTLAFLLVCLALVALIFRTGYRLKH